MIISLTCLVNATEECFQLTLSSITFFTFPTSALLRAGDPPCSALMGKRRSVRAEADTALHGQLAVRHAFPRCCPRAGSSCSEEGVLVSPFHRAGNSGTVTLQVPRLGGESQVTAAGQVRGAGAAESAGEQPQSYAAVLATKMMVIVVAKLSKTVCVLLK